MPKRALSLEPNFSTLSLHREPMNWASSQANQLLIPAHKFLKTQKTSDIPAHMLPYLTTLNHNTHLINHLKGLQQDFTDHLKQVVDTHKEQTESLKDHLRMLQAQILGLRSAPHLPVPVPVQALASAPPPPPPPPIFGAIKKPPPPPPVMKAANKLIAAAPPSAKNALIMELKQVLAARKRID